MQKGNWCPCSPECTKVPRQVESSRTRGCHITRERKLRLPLGPFSVLVIHIRVAPPNGVVTTLGWTSCRISCSPCFARGKGTGVAQAHVTMIEGDIGAWRDRTDRDTQNLFVRAAGK